MAKVMTKEVRAPGAPRRMGRPPKAPKRTMGDQERQELLDQIDAEKNFQAGLGRELPEGGTLGPLREAGDLGVNRSKIATRISRMAQAVEAGAPLELRGSARAAAIARHKQLEEQLPEILLTLKEQDLFPRDGHDYHAAVRKATKNEVGNPKTQKDIEEYRTLGRSLWPDDPEKASVERLRKKH